MDLVESNEAKVNEKPWLNKNGSQRTEGEIKELCKDWSMEEWESYLSDTEPPARETTIFSPEIMDNYSAEEYANVAFAMASDEKYELLKTALRAAIKELTNKQQQTINMYYCDGLPVAEIARRMKVHRKTVDRTLASAVENLREKFIDGSIHRKIKLSRDLAA